MHDHKRERDAELQRDYYKKAAAHYDAAHVSQTDEHAIALAWLSAIVDQCQYQSVLDIGAGTGRALNYLRDKPGVKVIGVEPSVHMRKLGHEKGIPEDQLVDGDALALAFPDNHFDVVCSFGVLHHIRDHAKAVSEMVRVARKAVFISDSNNFGQGTLTTRVIKQTLRALHLWGLFDLLRTRGKGYHYSEGDGIFYSYSVFNDIPIIKSKFNHILYMSTRPSGHNLFRSAPTLAIWARQSRDE